jgi:hypothetical protein
MDWLSACSTALQIFVSQKSNMDSSMCGTGLKLATEGNAMVAFGGRTGWKPVKQEWQ